LITATDKQAKGKDFSRSLYVAEDIKAGDNRKNVRSIRPVLGCIQKNYRKIPENYEREY
jgi:pseudaminic acid synthase